MKITFLGTSHGVPSAERFCSSAMIEVNGKIYFVDAGAPVADLMFRHKKNIRDFRALFTTHAHSDHIAGSILLVSLINWCYTDSEGDFFFTEQSVIDATKNWYNSTRHARAFDEERVRLKLAKAGVIFEDENIKVEYIPTKHIDNSFAILITEGNKRVLFGGDFSNGLEGNDIPEIIEKDIDCFVSEFAHFKVDDITPYLDRCRAKKVVFTHVFPDTKFEEIEKLKGKYPFEILAPSDDDVLEI